MLALLMVWLVAVAGEDQFCRQTDLATENAATLKPFRWIHPPKTGMIALGVSIDMSAGTSFANVLFRYACPGLPSNATVVKDPTAPRGMYARSFALKYAQYCPDDWFLVPRFGHDPVKASLDSTRFPDARYAHRLWKNLHDRSGTWSCSVILVDA